MLIDPTWIPTVYAGHAGTVVKVGYDARGYGKYIVLDCGDGWRLWYAHLKSVAVHEGDTLYPLQAVGVMGKSGNSSAPHVHVSLQRIGYGLRNYVLDFVVDPLPLMRRW